MNFNIDSQIRSLRLLIFGDSITAYRGNLEVASFQVNEALKKKGIQNICFNSGVPEDSTAMARKRFKRDVIELYPDIVFIMLGTNDSMLNVFQGITTPRVSEEDYEKNLRFFARELKKHSSIPVFMTIPPMYMTTELSGYYSKSPYTEKGFNFMVNRYVQLMEQIAEDEDIHCLAVNLAFWQAAGEKYENLPELFLDGMHPNQTGQKIIANEILDFLKNNSQVLNSRSNYGKDIANLNIKLLSTSANDINSKKKINFEIISASPVTQLEFRSKAHFFRDGEAKDFGEWLEMAFKQKGHVIKGELDNFHIGKSSLQFRTCNSLGNTIALGNVDYVY